MRRRMCISSGNVMRKKIVIVGVILILFGILAAAIATTTFNGSIKSFASQVLKNATARAAPGSFAYVPISLPNASQIYVLAELNKSANFYLMNGSAFSSWSAAMGNTINVTGVSAAAALEGNGTIFIARNSTFIDTASPVAPNSTEDIMYSSPNVTEPAGMYYVVADNTNGSASSGNGSVLARIVYYAPGTVSSNTIAEYSGSGNTVLGSGIAFLVLVVAGLVFVIYGIVKKPKPGAVPEQFQDRKTGGHAPGGEKPDNYISSLYDKIEGKGKKR